MDTRSKIISLEQVIRAAGELRAAGRRLAVGVGGFDVLQAAHARFFSELRDADDTVLAAVYDDESLCRITGQKRPVLAQQARAQMVAALAAVDYVVICSSADLDLLASRLRPDRLEHAAGERNIIEEVRERHGPSL